MMGRDHHNKGDGYFGIGVYKSKTEENIGTLWRSAYQLGADYIFTIGHRYKKQASDTTKTWRNIPLFQYKTYEEFKASRPYNSKLVLVEFGGFSEPLGSYTHPERAIYLLGAEDHGFGKEVLENGYCAMVDIASVRSESFNVAVAGSIVMYDRLIKQIK